MSLDKLLKLADSPALPGECRQWFKDGVSRYLDGAESLDDCLGLSTYGDDKQILEIRRDRHLRRAASTLDASSPWKQAVTLAKEINRFDSVIWPRWKLELQPPEDASQLRKHLFHARRCKHLPTSERHIHRILTD